MNRVILEVVLIVIGASCITLGFVLIRAKFMTVLAMSKKREDELTRRAYETAILKEIGDRIGYSLDAAKIVEIIAGSLGKLVPYSTVCRMIFDEKKEKIPFACEIKESVGPKFLEDVRTKMLSASREIVQKPYLASDLDEAISGNILDEGSKEPVRSFFNLPIVISGKLVGIINVSSTVSDLYNDENTEVLYRIAKLASEAASKLQELLESEKSRLLQAVQALSDGLLMVDTKYHLVLANRKLCQLLSTIASPSLFDIANAVSGNLDLRSMIEETIASHEELPAKEITVGAKNLQVMASKVTEKTTRKPVGVIVLFHDITDAKSLEKLRQDFTSMMVHELRAPLTSIKSTAELVRGDLGKLKSEELLKHLENIDSTAYSTLEVVNDLLDVAKMEAGRFDVVCESADLGQVLKDRVEAYKPLAIQKDLKLELSPSEGLPKGYFDKVRIKQVLNNLISNAVKFTQAGEIKVKAAQEIVNGNPIDIIVTVTDTGIGIDREEGDKLFSRFGQLVRGRRTAALKGSGLGLYIAKGIVEAQGGRIWFKSEGAGMGSTFYFTVPIAEALKSKKSPDVFGVPTISAVAQG